MTLPGKGSTRLPRHRHPPFAASVMPDRPSCSRRVRALVAHASVVAMPSVAPVPYPDHDTPVRSG